MLLSVDNPVHNTVIVFSVIMLLLYITKPDIIYNKDKNEFRQFGTTYGKTLLPIYVIGILLAIILYVFFNYISRPNKDKIDNLKNSYKKTKLIPNNKINENIKYYSDFDNPIQTEQMQNNQYYYTLQQYQQQQQIQQLQSQMQQLIQQQLNQQLQNHIMNSHITNVPNTNANRSINNMSVSKSDTILPNNLSI